MKLQTTCKQLMMLSLFFVTTGLLFAENQVFTNPSFPCRVVCESGWNEIQKNDSVLILEKSTFGKKTRMEILRYTIDTTGIAKYIDWAAFNFTINKELVYSFGDLIFFDSSESKRLGGYHAYELFAILSDSSKITWWAEYDRWAKSEKYGYLATIFGDTTDMKKNIAAYASMMDSISFGYSNIHQPYNSKKRCLLIQNSPMTIDKWHDLLGRKVVIVDRFRNSLLVTKKVKRCPVK